MRITRRGALRAAGGLILPVMLPQVARAAQLEFLPITISVPQGQSANTIQVINRGGGASTLQVRSFVWTQPADGSDNMVPSPAITASPPAFSLPEGETQVIRVVLHTPQSPAELAYRILVDELPPPNATNVQLALRVSLPVFAVPASGTTDLRWRAVRAGDGLMVTVHNAGALHARVTNVKVASSAHAAVEGQLQNRLPYVLAGADRRWAVPLPAPAGTALRLTADLDGKPVALSVAVEA